MIESFNKVTGGILANLPAFVFTGIEEMSMVTRTGSLILIWIQKAVRRLELGQF